MIDDIRLLLPKAARDRHREWQVQRDREVIGWVREVFLGRHQNTFYDAVGIHPVDGTEVRIGAHTELEEAADLVSAMHDDPEQFRGIHWH